MVFIAGLMCLAMILSLSTATVSASPQLPCEFYGTVAVSGNPAPAGTVITAYVNSVKQGSITVKEAGKYGGIGTFDERLIVMPADGDVSGTGLTITFKIGDKTADQTFPFTPGTSSELALTYGGGPAAVIPMSTGSSGPVQAMAVPSAPQGQTNGSAVPVVPVVTASPVIPVLTSAPAPVIPVVPVVTAQPVVQTAVPTPSVVPVVTLAVQPVPTVLSVVTPVNQTTGAGNITPAPVLISPPVNVSTPVPTMAAPVIPVVPVIPAAPNQSVNGTVPAPVNQTPVVNVTATPVAPVNGTITVSFPSGQPIKP